MKQRAEQFAAVLLAVIAAAGSLLASPTSQSGPSAPPRSEQTGARQSSPPDPGGPSSSDDSPELMLFKDIPVVVAAAKREQTTQDAAASVSIITADDIQLFGYRSLAEALRNQRSFFLQSNGMNWVLGDRGFLRPGDWNSRILVAVDGRPTNDLIYGLSHLDRDFVAPLETVKQVEIVRGPGSALYGTNAVFSIINVVTKDGSDVNGVSATLQGGTQDTYRASALFGETIGGWDVLACVTGYSSLGDRNIIYDGVNDAAHDYGHIKNADGEDVESLFLKARRGDLTIEADYETRVKGNRSATYNASFIDPGNEHETRDNFVMKYDHAVGPDQSIHAMLYYGHYAYYQGEGIVAMPPTPASTYYSTSANDWLGQEIHYDWQASKQVHLLVGADARQSLFTHQRDYDTIDGQVLNVPASTNTWGIFTEAEYKPWTWLALTGGIRLDDQQRVGDMASPRLAAVLKPDQSDALKFLYGRAFRAPSLYELLYDSPGAVDANPKLKPEIVNTYEFVWEREYEQGWRTSLGGYAWKMSDATENELMPDNSVQVRNGPAQWSHGVEAEIDRRWAGGASFRAYGTFTRAEHDGNRLPDSPEWIVGTALAVPIYKNNTFLSIDPQIVGSMRDDSGQTIHATYLTNVVLTSRDVIPGWDAQLGLYNLFAGAARMPRDGAFEEYQARLNYPSTQVLVSLTHRF